MALVMKMKPWMRDLISYIIIFAAVVIVRTFVATPVRVSGISMFPTLTGTEIMILNKLGKIQRFEVVVVDHAKEGKVIKRVFGLPGETIEIKDNIVYINDKAITDRFGVGHMANYPRTELEYDEYFMLGDNRDNSMDSRYFGPIKFGKIMGTTKLVIYPISKFGNIN